VPSLRLTNSDVLHDSDLVSELHRNYLLKFKFCLQFNQTRTSFDGSVIANALQTCSVTTPTADINCEIAQLQSALSAGITTTFQGKSNAYNISEALPIRIKQSWKSAQNQNFETLSE